MDLFEIVNNHVVPTYHALIIEPFKGIWESDLTPDKSYAMQIFQYIELLCSPKKSNPYFGIDEEARIPRVKKEIFGHPDSQIDTDILFAVMKYKELLEIASPSYPLLVSARKAGSKLQVYLDDFNMDERTKSGAMVIKPREVAGAIKDIPDALEKIEALHRNVNHELIEEGKTRNARPIGRYEE